MCPNQMNRCLISGIFKSIRRQKISALPAAPVPHTENNHKLTTNI